MVIILVTIGGYVIGEYWWILVDVNVIILVVIGGYSVNEYWWLLHCKPLMVILLMAIDGY
jgi:hypothetical protein